MDIDPMEILNGEDRGESQVDDPNKQIKPVNPLDCQVSFDLLFIDKKQAEHSDQSAEDQKQHTLFKDEIQIQPSQKQVQKWNKQQSQGTGMQNPPHQMIEAELLSEVIRRRKPKGNRQEGEFYRPDRRRREFYYPHDGQVKQDEASKNLNLGLLSTDQVSHTQTPG
jgi:hypothetical protein